jgi:CRISPR-associated protein Cmr1
MEAFTRRDHHTQEVKALEGQLTRSCLPPLSFGVIVLPHKGLTNSQREEILLALKILGLLGSLGSKARKGYGSLTLTRLAAANQEIWSPPATAQDLRDRLCAILREVLDGGAGPPTADDPPFSAFSRGARILIAPARDHNTSPLKLLDYVGREMIRYRSWGRNGKVLVNVASERNFKGDHDLMVVQRHPRTAHPKRIAFGLPHNYGKKEQHKEVEPQSFDRRASPLFLHIHQASESELPIGVLCFLPAAFLPEGGSDISVGGKRVPLNSGELWKPIEGFLDRFRDGTTKEPFGKVLEVKLG